MVFYHNDTKPKTIRFVKPETGLSLHRRNLLKYMAVETC